MPTGQIQYLLRVVFKRPNGKKIQVENALETNLLSLSTFTTVVQVTAHPIPSYFWPVRLVQRACSPRVRTLLSIPHNMSGKQAHSLCDGATACAVAAVNLRLHTVQCTTYGCYTRPASWSMVLLSPPFPSPRFHHPSSPSLAPPPHPRSLAPPPVRSSPPLPRHAPYAFIPPSRSALPRRLAVRPYLTTGFS